MCPKSSLETKSKATILICEDEPIVALDLELVVEEFGYEVIGPFASVEKALSAIEDKRPDGAVLDVNLRDGTVFPVATRLAEMGTGLVFHSGHALSEDIAERYQNAGFCEKPINTARLEQELQRVIAFEDNDVSSKTAN